MKKSIVLFFVVLFIHSVSAQEYSMDFGVVNANDFSLSYEKDLEAEAVIIFDKGESRFFEKDNGMDIRFTRTKRIKVISKNGVDYAEVRIPYYTDGYGKTEKVVEIEAFTYNLEDGRIRKKALDQTTVYTEKINERYKAKKFVFPDVKEGSIVEFRYIFETPFHYNLPDWSFQDKIPTIYSEYIAKMIPFYEYTYIAQGIGRFSYSNSESSKGLPRTFAGAEFNDMVHTYVMKDVPAFRDESFITSTEDYIMKIDFQLSKFYSPYGSKTDITTTWPKLTKDLLKHDKFGKYIKGASKIAGKIVDSEMDLSGKNALQRAELIIEYVKQSFEWDRFYGKYSSKSPKLLFSQKNGNIADINLFMISMLKEAGISAEPVILSTRNHGKVRKDYPFSHYFNYVIAMVHVDGGSFLADGTESLLAFNKIPTRCINGEGLLIREEEPSWVGLSITGPSLMNRVINIEINPESLAAKTIVSSQATNFEAYYYKRYYDNDSTELKKDLKESGFNDISSVRMKNYSESKKPYIVYFIGETEVEALDNKLVISPLLNFPMSKNSLTEKKRTYPVDLVYSYKKEFNSTVVIPGGYKVISVPKDYLMDNDLASIKIEAHQLEGKVKIIGFYSFKKAIYQPSEYARIKSYMNVIVKKFNEHIVLEKI